MANVELAAVDIVDVEVTLGYGAGARVDVAVDEFENGTVPLFAVNPLPGEAG